MATVGVKGISDNVNPVEYFRSRHQSTATCYVGGSAERCVTPVAHTAAVSSPRRTPAAAVRLPASSPTSWPGTIATTPPSRALRAAMMSWTGRTRTSNRLVDSARVRRPAASKAPMTSSSPTQPSSLPASSSSLHRRAAVSTSSEPRVEPGWRTLVAVTYHSSTVRTRSLPPRPPCSVPAVRSTTQPPCSPPLVQSTQNSPRRRDLRRRAGQSWTSTTPDWTPLSAGRDSWPLVQVTTRQQRPPPHSYTLSTASTSAPALRLRRSRS